MSASRLCAAIGGAVIGSLLLSSTQVGLADIPQLPATATQPAPPVSNVSIWAQLGWPATTKSAALARAAHVFNAPIAPSGPKIIGKLAAGTRVTIINVRDATAPTGAKMPCTRWAEISPRGFVCATSLSPSEAAPLAVPLPVVAPGEIVPGEYFIVDDAGVDLYRTRADAQAGQPTGELAGRVMVRNLETVWLDSLAYYRIDKGFVPMSGVRALHPSEFAGVRLTDSIRLPISWVVASVERSRRVLDAPQKRGRVVRTVERYQQVVVRASHNAFVDIGDDRHGSEWLPRTAIATASISTRPSGVADAALWLDIDLAQQTLVLYRGDTPVFATLVSTGKKNHATPIGEFTIHAKAAVTTMASEAGERAQYDVSAVPWAMRFTKGVYLHAAYWHDGFGNKRSHGCVNVSPRDARWLYDTLPPSVPDGWSELEITDGPVVRIRGT
ncbi:MAG: L,D-transpeptidase [Kofleriaceae bacterium]|nr:L,D-transpeptidase [Kofleriaceae bacterium]